MGGLLFNTPANSCKKYLLKSNLYQSSTDCAPISGMTASHGFRSWVFLFLRPTRKWELKASSTLRVNIQNYHQKYFAFGKTRTFSLKRGRSFLGKQNPSSFVTFLIITVFGEKNFFKTFYKLHSILSLGQLDLNTTWSRQTFISRTKT